MSANKKRQVIGKLITSGLRSGFMEMGTSPTTPLEFTVLSPTGIVKCDMGGNGIGLGIVAALEKSIENIPVRKANFRYRNPIESEPIDKSCTKAHCLIRKPIKIREQVSIFDISPVSISDDDIKICTDSEILSSCHSCNKKLHGKDIYMYREKPFCSPECRSREIGIDERREKQCSSQASSSPSNDISPNVYATGIFAI